MTSSGAKARLERGEEVELCSFHEVRRVLPSSLSSRTDLSRPPYLFPPLPNPFLRLPPPDSRHRSLISSPPAVHLSAFHSSVSSHTFRTSANSTKTNSFPPASTPSKTSKPTAKNTEYVLTLLCGGWCVHALSPPFSPENNES
jgi:hypothetical protein